MDAAESQQLSEKVFKTLEVGACAALCACAGSASRIGYAKPSHRGLALACERSQPAALRHQGARWSDGQAAGDVQPVVRHSSASISVADLGISCFDVIFVTICGYHSSSAMRLAPPESPRSKSLSSQVQNRRQRGVLILYQRQGSADAAVCVLSPFGADQIAQKRTELSPKP